MEDLSKEELAINFANLEPEIEEKVREFIRLDRMIDEMKDELKVYTDQYKELEDELIPIVAEMEDQKARIKEGIVEYSRGERKTQSYKKGVEIALTKVNEATKRVIQAALDATKKIHTYEKLTVKQEGAADKLRGFLDIAWNEVKTSFMGLSTAWSAGANELEQLAVEHGGTLKRRIDKRVSAILEK